MNKISLQEFIKEKLAKYFEPQRKGTPKGDPIGLSRVKYHATLLMLQGKKQEDIAKALGISHRLLRNWNTEDEFRKMVEKHCDEYRDRYNERLPRSVDEVYEVMGKPSADIVESKQKRDLCLIEDCESQSYSPELIDKIFFPPILTIRMLRDEDKDIISVVNAYYIGVSVLKTSRRPIPKELAVRIKDSLEYLKPILIHEHHKITDQSINTADQRKLLKVIVNLLVERTG